MTDLSVAEVLNRAADLLEKPGAWIQGNIGRTERGEPVTAENIGDAVCFCMAGAIWRAIDLPYNDAYPIVFGSIFPLMNRSARQPNGMGTWNDEEGRTQAEVVAALRLAALSTPPRVGEG